MILTSLKKLLALSRLAQHTARESFSCGLRELFQLMKMLQKRDLE